MRITKYRLEQTDDFRPALMKEYSLNYKDAGVLDSPDVIYKMMKDVFHLTDAAEELAWECPHCGNRDMNKMHVARRVCGYIKSNYTSPNRLP